MQFIFVTHTLGINSWMKTPTLENIDKKKVFQENLDIDKKVNAEIQWKQVK